MLRGHVRKRGKTWTTVVYIGLDEQGKKKYKWFGGFTNKREAEKFLAQKAVEINNGTFINADTSTLGAFIDQWLQYKQSRIRPGSYVAYEKALAHISTELRGLKLTKLQPQHLEQLYLSLENDGLANRTIKQLHVILNSVLKQALKWGLITRNPASMIDPPKYVNKQITVWTVEQLQRFLNAATEDDYYPLFLLAIATGMRRGELLGLRWCDLDLESQRLHVVQAISYVNGRPTVGTTKTQRGHRTVPFPNDVALVLRAHYQRQRNYKEHFGYPISETDYVFAKVDNPTEPVNASTLVYHFKEICLNDNLPRIRFHDLRHTHATLLLQQGVNPKVIQERLGHSRVTQTLDTYSHVLPDMQRAASDEMAAMLEQKLNK